MAGQGLDLDEPEHRVADPLDELDAVEARQQPDPVEGLDGGLPDDEARGVGDGVGLARALGQLEERAAHPGDAPGLDGDA